MKTVGFHFKSVHLESDTFNILPPSTIDFVGACIQDGIDCIEVLNHRIHERVNLEEWEYKPLRQRVKPKKIFALEEEEDEYYKKNVKRLHNVTDFLCTLLKEIRIELLNEGQFALLKGMLIDFKDTKRDDYRLLNSKEKEKYETLKTEVDIFNTKIRSLQDHMVENLRTECIQVESECAIKTSYMKNWENSQVDQLLFKNKIETNCIEKCINDTQRKIDDELSAHMSITSYIWLYISDVTKEIKLWEKKYEVDYDKKHYEICQIKDKRVKLQELRTEIENEYIRREREIRKYLEWKEEMRLAEESAEEEKRKRELTSIIETNNIISSSLSHKHKHKSRKSKSLKKPRTKA